MWSIDLKIADKRVDPLTTVPVRKQIYIYVG